MIVQLGRALFRYRSLVPTAVYLAMIFLPRTPFPRPELLWVGGGLLVFSGAWLRLWSIRHIGKRARTRGNKARFLITTGPFAMTRNPLYIANMLTACGFCTAFELPWHIPVYVALAGGFYSLIVRYEEDLLIGKFGGEYKQYMRTVPRWVPELRMRTDTDALPYAWRQVLRWERSYLGILFAGTLAVLMKRILL